MQNFLVIAICLKIKDHSENYIIQTSQSDLSECGSMRMLFMNKNNDEHEYLISILFVKLGIKRMFESEI